MRWCSRELNVVVALLPQKCWESTLTFLARVEAVPAVIHVRVQSIVESELIILDVHWVQSAVHSVSVQIVKDHNTNIVSAADPGVPLVNKLASRDSLR